MSVHAIKEASGFLIDESEYDLTPRVLVPIIFNVVPIVVNRDTLATLKLLCCFDWQIVWQFQSLSRVIVRMLV